MCHGTGRDTGTHVCWVLSLGSSDDAKDKLVQHISVSVSLCTERFALGAASLLTRLLSVYDQWKLFLLIRT